MKKSAHTKVTTKPAERHVSENREEEIAISDTKTGATVALIPYKPLLGAGREIYRDRLTKKQAEKAAAIILKALNS